MTDSCVEYESEVTQRLWRKLRVVCLVLYQFSRTARNVQLYGASRSHYSEVMSLKQYSQEKKAVHSAYVLLPSSPVRKVWSVLMYLLLTWTALIDIFRVCYIESNSMFWIVLEGLKCGILVADVGISFLSAYTDADNALVTGLGNISKHYLKTWFVVDVVSSSNSALGHMHRLLHIVRVTKFWKSCYQLKWSKRLTRCFSRASIEVLKFCCANAIFIHILACLWFYTARLSDFHANTWVTRYNQQDHAPLDQYVVSMYFVVTTLATVGLGDIVAYTQQERVCAICLMLFGVAFFSYTISNVSTMLNNSDSKASGLKVKLDSLEEFAKVIPLPKPLADRVAAHIRHNFMHESRTWQGRESLLRDLPLFLQSELGLFMYHRLVSKVHFFQDKDPNFICDIAPKLQVLCLKETQVVYMEHSFPEEVYFLMKGRVVLRNEGVTFLTYVPGSYFGELDILWGRLRASSAYIEEEAEMLVLSKKHFLLMLGKFSSVKEEVLEVAHVREARNIKALKDALGFAATKEMDAYFRNSVSNEDQPKMNRRKSVRILKQKENNRIKWNRLNSLDQAVTPKNEWDEVLTRTRKARKLSRTPLVSAQEVFVPKEREAQWNIVRRKRKAVQPINRQDSTIPDLRVTPRSMQLTGVMLRVKQYESRLHIRMIKLETLIQKVEAKHKELGEEILRLFT